MCAPLAFPSSERFVFFFPLRLSRSNPRRISRCLVLSVLSSFSTPLGSSHVISPRLARPLTPASPFPLVLVSRGPRLAGLDFTFSLFLSSETKPSAYVGAPVHLWRRSLRLLEGAEPKQREPRDPSPTVGAP